MTNKMFEKGALYAHYARPIEFKTCNTPRERRADWHDRAAAVLEELYHPVASYCISEQQQDQRRLYVSSLNQPSVHRSFMTFMSADWTILFAHTLTKVREPPNRKSPNWKIVRESSA